MGLDNCYVTKRGMGLNRFIFKRFYSAIIKMGSMRGKTMEDNFKKQQDFMLEMNRWVWILMLCQLFTMLHAQDNSRETDPDAESDAGADGGESG